MRQGTMKLTDEMIMEAYEQKITQQEACAKHGVTVVTWWRRAKKLGLKWSDLPAHEGAKKLDLNEILNGEHPQYQTYKLKQRLINVGLKSNKCEECGVAEWNGKQLNIQLDHINGNSHDHRLENLRMLCPNCHSQTETYSGKNK